MIKVSILYPRKPGARFDLEYYVSQHMPLAGRLLAPALRRMEVDAAIDGAPGEPPAFFGGCQLYFDSVASFMQVWASAQAQLTADIPRYTDVAPLIQFNELRLAT
jgi:uncharacterized protein (TIGR02118 family)